MAGTTNRTTIAERHGETEQRPQTVRATDEQDQSHEDRGQHRERRGPLEVGQPVGRGPAVPELEHRQGDRIADRELGVGLQVDPKRLASPRPSARSRAAR